MCPPYKITETKIPVGVTSIVDSKKLSLFLVRMMILNTGMEVLWVLVRVVRVSFT